MIDIYNVSHKDYLEDLFANEKIIINMDLSRSDSFPPGSDDTDFDPEGDLRLIEELLNNDPSSPLPLSHNPLSGSTTSSSPDHFLEEFADELALIESFPPKNDDMTQEHKKVKEISISNASLILKDFNPPLYELPFHKEVPGSETLLSFSSENEEKVFNPGILTSKGVHTSLLLELSHRGPKAFKIIKFMKARWRFFLALIERTSVFWMFRVSTSIPLDQLKYGGIGSSLVTLNKRFDCPDFEASRARGFVLRSLELQILSFIMGIQYPNLID
ncbi:hypothetical protein Tco_0774744 [Tanacetum coccineum]|uniref:Reverse transcriptase domain-containing protein n=1 Tax=Tanacetum coccineum TaxID=301880 RepID=A0ABQ4ZTL9_9ASTR